MSESDIDRLRIESLFCEVVQLGTPEMRADFLDEKCRGEPEIRREVEVLLTLNDRAGKVDFLNDQPKVPAPISSGQQIGPYVVIHSIGEGSFADVFLAEQERPVRRMVALKILKLGMGSEEVVARFEAEKQALALMEHPGIAQVFDAGTTEGGRSYFSMEYVDGIPITRYCREKRLKISARLELFADVCSAVQHAHQKGVIHRDLKPENILVATRDGQPIPKVIDFGIAKATQEPLTDRTIVTHLHQLIGTPAYLSPEQTWGSELDVDTRADIYSLGVLLYELLTGVTPFKSKELVRSGLKGMAEVICQRQPLRPSLRAKTVKSGEPKNVYSRALVGGDTIGRELDWVVLKALEKERDRRYSSAAAFSDDVVRYLSGETVSAVAPSLLYAARKFVVRHRKAVLAVVTLFVLLLTAGVIAGTQTFRALRAEVEVRESRREGYVNDVRIAQVFLENGHSSAARDRLSKYQSENSNADDLRGFAWYYLWDQIRGEYIDELVGHDKEVYCLDYSPDGSLLVSGGKDERVILWDVASGRMLQEWAIEGTYDSLEFSHDGLFFGVSTRHRQIQLWERRGTEYFKSEAWEERSEARIRFSPTDDLLAIRLSDGSLKLRDLDSDEIIQSIPSRSGSRVSGQGISFTADGRYVAHRATDTEIELRDIRKDSKVQTFAVEPSYGRGTIVVNPTESLLISSAYSSGPRIWNFSTGELIAPSKLLSMPWTAPTYSQDGRYLLTAGRDQRIHMYDSRSFELIRTFRGQRGLINAISFNPSSQRFASGGADSRILIWDVSKLGGKDFLEGRFRPRVNPFFLGPDNDIIVRNGYLEIAPGYVGVMHQEGITRIDREDFVAHKHNLPISVDGISTQAGWFVRLHGHSAANRIRAVGVRELEYWTFDGVRLRSVPLEFEGLSSSRSGISIARDLLALGNSAGEICLFDLRTGKQLGRELVHDQPVWELAFSPTGNQLVSTQRAMYGAPALRESEEALLWDIDGDRTLGMRRILKHPGSRPDTAVFSHSGHRIALSGGKTISLWDAETAAQVDLLEGHRLGVFAMAFSPDDRILASGGGDGVRLWDLETGLELLEIRQERTVTGLAFSPSGDVLVFVAGPATLSADHIRILRAPMNQL